MVDLNGLSIGMAALSLLVRPLSHGKNPFELLQATNPDDYSIDRLVYWELLNDWGNFWCNWRFIDRLPTRYLSDPSWLCSAQPVPKKIGFLFQCYYMGRSASCCKLDIYYHINVNALLRQTGCLSPKGLKDDYLVPPSFFPQNPSTAGGTDQRLAGPFRSSGRGSGAPCRGRSSRC